MNDFEDCRLLIEKKEKKQRDIYNSKKKKYVCVDFEMCRQNIYQNSTKKIEMNEIEGTGSNTV